MINVLNIINAYHAGYDTVFRDIEHVPLNSPEEEEAYTLGRNEALLEIHQGAIPIDYSVDEEEYLI